MTKTLYFYPLKSVEAPDYPWKSQTGFKHYRSLYWFETWT